jgi:hypothetical protein
MQKVSAGWSAAFNMSKKLFKQTDVNIQEHVRERDDNNLHASKSTKKFGASENPGPDDIPAKKQRIEKNNSQVF